MRVHAREEGASPCDRWAERDAHAADAPTHPHPHRHHDSPQEHLHLYLPSYYLSFLLLGVLLDLILRPLGLVKRARIGLLLGGLAAVHWYLYSPLFFGWPINQAYCELLRLLPGMDWRCGARAGVVGEVVAAVLTASVAQRT
jgi:hypothetical protein